MAKKRDDKEEFYDLVHREYINLHKTGKCTKIRDLFRQAKDSYEQKYIFSLLTNNDFGVSKYIKSKDVFSINKEKGVFKEVFIFVHIDDFYFAYRRK